MKKVLAIIAACIATHANAAVVDVVNVSGEYIMLTDERAPSGMPLFRAFTNDGQLFVTGGYVPNYTGYTLHLPLTGRTPHIPRGNAVARRQLHDALDYRCRGDSGDDPKTQRACQLRDQLEY